jgi:hypothetical protein
MPRKPVSTFSEAVKVSLDEITTELLRRVPEAQVADAISSAYVAAEKRLRNNRRSRHDRYHSQMFFRRMVERFPNPPESVAAVVGLKGGVNGAQMEVPGVEVRHSGEERMPTDNAQAVDEVLEDPPEDEFADLLDMPVFEDFAVVFSEYPYVMMADHDGRKVLVLGYLSARDRQTDDLIRRNCVVIGPNESEGAKGTAFNDLQSITGILRRTKKGMRQFIKVIPYQPGTRIRFWTHVKGPSGSGDRPNLNRYIVVTGFGLTRVRTRAELDSYPITEGMEA